jgi:hypothetical protein
MNPYLNSPEVKSLQTFHNLDLNASSEGKYLKQFRYNYVVVYLPYVGDKTAEILR